MKTKLPIWVFKLSVTVLIIVLGSMNVYTVREFKAVTKDLKDHIQVSNKILKNISKNSREVALNQKAVLEKLDLPYIEIPGYYGDD